MKKVSVVSIGRYEDAQKVFISKMDNGEDVYLRLKRDPENIYDSNAIKVFVEKNDELIQLGFVSASDKFVLDGELNAKETSKIIDSSDNPQGFFDVKVLNYHNTENNTLIISTVMKDDKEVKKDLSLEFGLSGSLTVYPKKEELIDDFNKNLPELIITIKKDNGLIGFYKNEPIGNVLKKDEAVVLDTMKNEDMITAEVLDIERGIVRVKYYEDIGLTNNTSFESEIQRIVKENIVEEEDLQKRISYMKDNGVSDVVIKMVLESYVKYPKDVAAKIINPETLFVDGHGLVDSALSSIVLKENLRFEGEKGVGKNKLTETLSWLLNRPLYEFSTNSRITNTTLFGSDTFQKNKSNLTKNDLDKLDKELFGKSYYEAAIEAGQMLANNNNNKYTNELNLFNWKMKVRESVQANIEDNQELVFKPSVIVEAFVNGGILVLDEFNTGTGDVLSALNGMLDFRKRLNVHGYKTVEGHDNFIAITTENRGYVGTFRTNQATADRFSPIIFPEPNIGAVIENEVPGVKQSVINICEKLHLGMKSANEISEDSMTSRGFIAAAKQTLIGKPIKDALIKDVANRAEPEDRDTIKAMIDVLIA